MLLYNWRLNKNIIFFSLYIIIAALTSILFDIVINGGSTRLLMILMGNSGPMLFLSGPLLYFFIRGLVYEDKQFTDKDLLHLIPFFLNMVLLIPYLFKPVEYKLAVAEASINNFYGYLHQKLIFFPAWLTGIVRIISMIAYIIISMKILYKGYKSKKEDPDKYAVKVYISNFRWLNLIAIISLILVFISFYGLVLVKLFPEKYYLMNPGVAFNFSVFLHMLMSLIILMNPRILYGLPTRDKLDPLLSNFNMTKPNQMKHSVLMAADKARTYTEYFEGLSEKILAFVENARPYLNPDFSSNDLSEVFEVPQHHIQFCIRYYIRKDFKKMICEYRIRYALNAFRNALELDDESIRNIVYESGYKSYKRFSKCFVNYMGLTPEEWIKEKI
jgi:AraC-like DNA-binding protein